MKNKTALDGVVKPAAFRLCISHDVYSDKKANIKFFFTRQYWNESLILSGSVDLS